MKTAAYGLLLLLSIFSFLSVNATESDSNRLTRSQSVIKNKIIKYPQVAKIGSIVTINYSLRTGSPR